MAQRRKATEDLFERRRPRDRRLADVGATGEALLTAVLENPDDDAPRLVYADAMQERGDPRGEFISLQIAAERMTPGPEREGLEARAAALLDKHQKTWVQPFMGDRRTMEIGGRKYTSTSPTKWKFSRGFVHTATVSAESFPALAEGLFSREPVIRLHLTNRGLEQVLAAPQLERLRELDLTNMRLRDAATALFSGTRFLALRWLELTKCGLGVKGAAAMAKARPDDFPSLVRLGLSNTALSDAALGHLSTARVLSGVRHLDLSLNGFSSAGFAALVASPWLAKLETLELRGCAVGVAGARALARSALTRSLSSLTLQHCALGDEGFSSLLAAPFPKLRRANLSSNDLTGSAVAAMPPWLDQLEALDLSHNSLDEGVVQRLKKRFGARVETW